MPNGYVYTWTGAASANFGVASNWYNDSTGATATTVPGVNDEALISSAGSVTGSGNVYDLGLTGSGGTLTIAATLSGTNLFVASSVAVASGASLVFSNAIQIGDDASSVVAHVASNLTISAGGLIRSTLQTAGYYGFYIGQSGGTGTLTVSGQGALADAGARGFDVGNAGTGVISIAAGGQLTGGTGDSYQNGVAEQLGLTLGDPSGSGTLIVSGSGAGATFGDAVEVGYGGMGVITVQSGGTLTAGDGAFSLDIADQQGGTAGSGSVSFSGGTGSLKGLAEVGTFGQGTLALSAGATLTIAETSTNAADPYASVLVGVQSGSSGTISIGSQALLKTDHGLAIGDAGRGELDIDGGQAKISTPTSGSQLALDVGEQAGSSGLVSITAGLLQDVSGTGMIVGDSGSGTLLAHAGGALIAGGSSPTSSGLILGESSGGNGTLSVSGSGATLTVTGDFQDGSAGTGTFTLSGGAQASIGSPNPNSILSFGLGTSGGVGRATITGAGTVLSDSGQVAIGGSGTGTLAVTAGGRFAVTTAAGQTVPDVIIASTSSTITSSATVTGSGSTWSVQGAMFVGNSGHGALTIESGGHVSAGSVTIGGGSGTVGNVLVAGPGALLSTNTLQVGTSLTDGTLTVVHATTEVAGNATINGTLSLTKAGLFDATGTLDIGKGALVHGIGTLEAGSIVDDGVISVNGGTLKCIGPITGSGLVRTTGGGNLILANGTSTSARIQFSAGSTLTAGTVADIAGGINGWTTGDLMHFTSAKIVSDSVSGHTLSLFNPSHHLIGTLTFGGAISTHNFVLTADGNGTLIRYHS